MGTMEDLFDGFVSGDIAYGSWWGHINEYANIKNIHFIHFEDLLEVSYKKKFKLFSYF